jgi:oligosaccharide repeat unit polymerase
MSVLKKSCGVSRKGFCLNSVPDYVPLSPQIIMRPRLIHPRVSKNTYTVLTAVLAISVFYILAGVLYIEKTEKAWRLFWLVGGLLALVIIALFKHSQRLDWLSPPVLYMIVFWLFHFGLVFPGAIIPDIIFSLPPWYVHFFTSPDTSIAVFVSLLFLTAFCWGAACRSGSYRRIRKGEEEVNPGLRMVGIASILIGVGIFMAFVLSHGIATFFQSYNEFFLISGAPTTSIFVIAYGLMLILFADRSRRTFLTLGAITYVPLFFLMMASGSRTGPLFSLIVLLAMMNIKGIRLPRLLLIIGSVVGLALIATIRDTRIVGIENARETSSVISIGDPITGMTELGGSICPVVATIDYFRSGHLLYGESYGYPFFRQVAKLLGRDPGSEESDMRFIARYITRIYGAIGYSTVAEAYANGGMLGIVIFGSLWGLILKLLMKNAGSPLGSSILGVILIPMMSNIRNSFIYVPAWIFMGILPIIVQIIFRSRRRRKVASSGSPKTSISVTTGGYQNGVDRNEPRPPIED